MPPDNQAASPTKELTARGGPISQPASAAAGERPGQTGVPRRLGDTAGYLLAKAGGRAIRDLNRALEPFGLRSRHYGVLAAAAEYGGLSQREMGALLAIDPSAIVALVDDLERAGLVRRELPPGDRRTRLIVTTSEGRAVLARTRELSAAVDGELLAPLTEPERAALLDLLRRIIAGPPETGPRETGPQETGPRETGAARTGTTPVGAAPAAPEQAATGQSSRVDRRE